MGARSAGVSVRDLAAAAGMSKSQVSRRYKAVWEPRAGTSEAVDPKGVATGSNFAVGSAPETTAGPRRRL